MSTQIWSWNVNGMRSVLKKGFLETLEAGQPDILCVQESRALPDDLSAAQREPQGYTSFWMPAKKKGYSGVGVYTKTEPLSISKMGPKEFDDEGRVQVLEYPDFHIVNAYYPNSQPERKRIDYKLRFCTAMTRLCNKLVRDGKNVIVCGDYNIAHEPIDLARPKQNEDNPGYLPEERQAMTRFLKHGYVDTFRLRAPEEIKYSWWSYRSGARARNIGWRIDYHCVNEAFADRVQRADILNDVHGSDHCPVELVVN